MTDEGQLVVDAGQVRAIADEIRGEDRFGLDLEFYSADRYVPEFCLVQLVWGSGQGRRALVDAISADIAPLCELVEDPSITCVAHSAKQDLQLLARRHSVRVNALYDTQIAAAFCGLGDQVGYGKLVHRLLGEELDKGSQFTDWRKRPLSAKQTAYALDDVRFLLPMTDAMNETLKGLGRESWVDEECEALASLASCFPPSSEAYRNVSGAGGLRGESLAALRALASWREELALSTNKPPSWILPDPVMVEACKRLVKSGQALRRLRGVGQGIARKHGDEIIRVIDEGRANEPPPSLARRGVEPALQARMSVATAVVNAEAQRQQIAPRFLGTKADVEELVRWHASAQASPSPALAGGWRREMIGAALAAWLEGECGVYCDEQGMPYLSPPRSTEK